MTNFILKYLKFKTNKFFKNQIVKYSKIIYSTLVYNFPSFCCDIPHHLWRRSEIRISDGGGPSPKKGDSQSPSESLLESLSSWRFGKKNNIKHTGTPGQTLADLTLSNGKKPAYLCKIFFLQLNMVDFEWFNSMFIYPLLFSRGFGWDEFWIALTGHVRTVTALEPSCHHRCRPASNLIITNESNKDASPQKEQTERNRFKSTMNQSVSIWFRIPFISQPKPYTIHPDRHGWWKLLQIICFPYKTTPVCVELSHKFQKNCRLPFLKLVELPAFCCCFPSLSFSTVLLFFSFFSSSSSSLSSSPPNLSNLMKPGNFSEDFFFCLAHLLDIWILRIIGKVLYPYPIYLIYIYISYLWGILGTTVLARPTTIWMVLNCWRLPHSPMNCWNSVGCKSSSWTFPVSVSQRVPRFVGMEFRCGNQLCIRNF